MGMLRSTTGCLTCRSRRVKCDEALPICGNCHKSNRACRREERSRVRFQKAKRAPPSPVASLSPSSSRPLGASTSPLNNEAFLNLITHPVQPAVSSPELVSRTPSKPLTRHEASLVQYYTEHLGRWLDCTDAARQFTLSIPALCTRCPVLLEAIVTFAARHRRGPNDTEAASLAHERCIAMLIVLLGSDHVADDDVLLSAIVILRVFEQLTAQGNGTDQERHLAGCSALLRTSQGSSVDPAAPGLRDAAFWVYLRQCLYNACINQQAPNVDFSLTLMSIQNVMACESLGRSSVDLLRVETAWANTMTWICATTVNFCFGPQIHPLESKSRMDKWLELRSTVDNWAESRPHSFNPIWEGAGDGQDDNDRWSPFPQYFFAADWHVVAFGFYQLACILLIMYKPTPRFAIRSAGAVRLRKEDAQILEHARALCGSCRSHPDNVPARITLCHSVFLWGGLISDPCERAGVLQLLQELETDHAWPTTWIVSSLNEEWGTL